MITLFSSLELFYICVFLCTINLILNIHREYKESNVTYEILKDSFNKFIQYTDKYYINNFFYTFIASYIYICGTVVIFLYIRYIFIGQFIFFMKLDAGYPSIDKFLLFLFYYFLFICCLLLYKHLLKRLFYIEIIKLRIYMVKNKIYETIKDILMFPLWAYIFGFIWMFSYRIATSTYDPYLFDKDHSYWFERELDSLEHLDYDELYKNVHIQKIGFICLSLANKYHIIKNVFFMIAKLFKLFHRHSETNCFMFTHYTLFILLFLYELYYYSEFYYIYHGSLVLLLIITLKSYRDFEKKLDDLGTLHDYFYGKKSNYNLERLSILHNKNYQLDLNIWPNKSLFISFEGDIGHGLIWSIVDNNMESHISSYSDPNKIYFTLLYLRNSIILSFLIIGTCFLFEKNLIIIKTFNFVIPLWVLFISSFIIMIFCSYNTFYKKYINEYTSSEGYVGIVYNRRYSIIFWIITMMQGYLFWLIIFKPQIIFLTKDILLELPYNILSIQKVYSVQEKIMYLFQYFEHHITFTDLKTEDKEYLRYILRQIKFKSLFYGNDYISLQDIQVYIKLLVNNYSLHEAIISAVKDYINKHNENNELNDLNPWYILLRNTLIIGGIYNTIYYMVSLYLITKKMNTLEGTHSIVKFIIQTALYKKFTVSHFLDVLFKILKYFP